LKKFLSSCIFSFFLIGCGGSSEGVASKNKFDVKSFDPYTDEGFKYAWHLRVVEPDAIARNISNNSHINIYSAWKKTRGAGVKVAIIDYDFNSNNPDIVSNIYKTYNTNKNSTNVTNNNNSHGTSVAGILSASKNDYGIIGVAPESKLILISADLTDDDQKVEAFKKAKEFGADVICCSWGFINNLSQELKQAIKDDYESGITIIFASGNNSLDLEGFGSSYDEEAELPWVIGVGASTELNKKADYSNYGDEIDILAPAGSRDFGLYTDDYYHDQFKNLDFSGTSASAPVVAGVVALMKSVNPSLTPDEVREILIKTADKIEPDIAKYDSNGFSKTHAYGKVNASAAVAKALTY